MDYGRLASLTILVFATLLAAPATADTQTADGSNRHKRSSEGVEEYYQDNSRYMKRPQRFSFGLGKRSDSTTGYEDDDSEELSMDDYDYILSQMSKRAPYNFGLGKRFYRKREPYGFGLGKRSPYQFGLGKREPYAFGLGKRSQLKREPYAFGLGRR